MALRNDVPADGEAASAWRDQPARTPGTDRRPWPRTGADQAPTAGDVSAARHDADESCPDERDGVVPEAASESKLVVVANLAV